jgi:hypothetical protein
MTQARVRKVLKLVDELALDVSEIRLLRAELDARGESIVDLSTADADERTLALTIKNRIDAAARGSAPLVTMKEAARVLRARRKTRGHTSAR